MPDFEITSPDGKKFVVTAPEGASQADILAYAQKSMGTGQEISAPRGSQPNIDMNREIGFMPRLAASLKMTPEGKSDFLKKIGYDTVTDSTGVQFVRDGKTMYPVNKRGFTANDLADIGGDVAQAVPTAIVGTNPFTVAGAGAASNAVRQGISSMMPGDDSMTPVDRLTASRALELIPPWLGVVRLESTSSWAGRSAVRQRLSRCLRVRQARLFLMLAGPIGSGRRTSYSA
jgi:hypothetical protein